MVFPQGWFSTPAIRALRASGYLAAVNTTCFPTDEESGPLTVADFLRPAVSRFYGFPVFQRRYPRRLLDCAFDLFIGRPALLVEHHQYFGDDCAKLEEFVSGLQEIEPALDWSTLSSQLARSCIQRSDCGNKTEVRFFTRKFEFTNTHNDHAAFLLKKYEPLQSTVSSVLVDGKNTSFSFDEDYLALEVALDPGRSVRVEIQEPTKDTGPARGPGLKYRAGVPVRRMLSEFRDNTLVRHPRLLKAATGLARKMKATADYDREDLD
jgi:hypothetical protein